MVTALVFFKLPMNIGKTVVLDGIRQSFRYYRGQQGLIRKYICIDWEKGEGRSVYLWQSRDQAEAFFAAAKSILAAQLGSEPTVEIWDTAFIVDNNDNSVWEGDAPMS